MNANFVSVIIPCFNSAKFISKAINSVLRQSYKMYEIIVVNDGSTDKSLEVLKRYKTKIKIINIKNSGPSVARNIGIKCSSGQLISFLDSDDFWHPDKLKKQVHYANKLKEINIFTTNLWSLTKFKKQKKTNIQIFPYVRQFSKNCYIINRGIYPKERYFYSSPSCLLVRKKIFNKYGYFDKKYKSTEDSELFMRWMIGGEKSIFIDECLAYYELRNSKSLTKNIKKWIFNHFNYWIDLEKKIFDHEIMNDFIIMRKKTLQNSLITVIKNFYPVEARQYIVKNIKYLISFKIFFIYLLTFVPITYIKLLKKIKLK